jgi:hypothetical protein
LLKTKRAKESPPKKQHHGYRKTLTLGYRVVVAEGKDEVCVDVGE